MRLVIFLFLVNDSSQVKYSLTDSTILKNSLSGLDYSKDKIKAGDRIFLYADRGVESLSTPSNRSKSVDGVVEKDFEGDNFFEYRIMEGKEIYFYPVN